MSFIKERPQAYQVQNNPVSITLANSPYTVPANISEVNVNTTGGNVRVNLPNTDRTIIINKTSSDSYLVTLFVSGTQIGEIAGELSSVHVAKAQITKDEPWYPYDAIVGIAGVSGNGGEVIAKNKHGMNISRGVAGTDDATVIDAVLSSMSALGGLLQLTSDSFVIPSPLTGFPENPSYEENKNIVIAGNGNKTVLTYTGLTDYCIKFLPSSVPPKICATHVIRDMKINSKLTSGGAIYHAGCSGIRLQNLYVLGNGIDNGLITYQTTDAGWYSMGNLIDHCRVFGANIGVECAVGSNVHINNWSQIKGVTPIHGSPSLLRVTTSELIANSSSGYAIDLIAAGKTVYDDIHVDAGRFRFNGGSHYFFACGAPPIEYVTGTKIYYDRFPPKNGAAYEVDFLPDSAVIPKHLDPLIIEGQDTRCDASYGTIVDDANASGGKSRTNSVDNATSYACLAKFAYSSDFSWLPRGKYTIGFRVRDDHQVANDCVLRVVYNDGTNHYYLNKTITLTNVYTWYSYPMTVDVGSIGHELSVRVLKLSSTHNNIYVDHIKLQYIGSEWYDPASEHRARLGIAVGSSTGTGTEQTIAHGLAAIQTGCKAWIRYPISATLYAEMEVPMDATYIRPKVKNGLAYDWRVE